MRNILTILLIILFACNSNERKPVDKTKTTTDPVRQFAEFVLQGGEPKGIEEGLLERQIFDSINSPIDSTRDYYFKVSLLLINQGTASLNPNMAKNVHTLINKKPEYVFSFLKKYDEDLIVDIGVCLGNYYQFYKKKELAVEADKTLQSYTTNNEFKGIVSNIIRGIGYGIKE